MIDADAFKIGIGRQITMLRVLNGWTQAQLADRVDGMALTYVGVIEGGRANPTLERVIELADAFDVHPSELLAGAEATARRVMAQRAIAEPERDRSPGASSR